MNYIFFRSNDQRFFFSRNNPTDFWIRLSKPFQIPEGKTYYCGLLEFNLCAELDIPVAVTTNIIESSYIRETSLPILRVLKPRHKGEFHLPHMMKISYDRIDAIHFQLLNGITLNPLESSSLSETIEKKRDTRAVPEGDAVDSPAFLTTSNLHYHREREEEKKLAALAEGETPLTTYGVLLLCEEKYVHL